MISSTSHSQAVPSQASPQPSLDLTPPPSAALGCLPTQSPLEQSQSDHMASASGSMPSSAAALLPAGQQESLHAGPMQPNAMHMQAEAMPIQANSGTGGIQTYNSAPQAAAGAMHSGVSARRIASAANGQHSAAEKAVPGPPLFKSPGAVLAAPGRASSPWSIKAAATPAATSHQISLQGIDPCSHLIYLLLACAGAPML